MIIIESFFDAWKRAFKFKGKTSRQYYWYFLLGTLLAVITVNIISSLLGPLSFSFYNGDPFAYSDNFLITFLSGITSLVHGIINTLDILIFFGSIWVILPLTIRRLRDMGKDWKWIFLHLLPFIGFVIILFWTTRPSLNSKK